MKPIFLIKVANELNFKHVVVLAAASVVCSPLNAFQLNVHTGATFSLSPPLKASLRVAPQLWLLRIYSQSENSDSEKFFPRNATSHILHVCKRSLS